MWFALTLLLRGNQMPAEYRFVNGEGTPAHQAKIQEAADEGFVVKCMTINPSPLATTGTESIIVLMERVGPSRRK